MRLLLILSLLHTKELSVVVLKILNCNFSLPVCTWSCVGYRAHTPKRIYKHEPLEHMGINELNDKNRNAFILYIPPF